MFSLPEHKARDVALAALLPALVALAVFGPPALHADWISDDRPLLAFHLRPGDLLGEWTTPTHAHAADRVGGYLWRPLTSSLYQVVGELFGRTPVVFRLLNAILHAANAAGLALVGLRLGASARAAGALALGWALHPLVPDAVCWMADTYDLQAAGFLLAAVWVAFGSAGRAARAGGVAALFLLALLCKESSLAFAGALTGALLVFRGWRDAAVLGAAAGLTGWLHGRWHEAIVGTFEKSAADLVVWRDLLGVWTDYLRWPLTLPVRAGFTHLVEPGAEPLSALGLGLLLLTAALWGMARRRGRRELDGLAVGVAVYAVMLSPVALAAIAFGQQSSRYLYMPLAVAVPFLGARRWPPLPRWAVALAVAGYGALAVPTTLDRVADWQDERHLFAAEVQFEPGNPFAVKCLGRLMTEAGRVEDGLKLWGWALDNPPSSSFVMDVQAERLDFAVAALRAGQVAQANDKLRAFLAEEQRAGREVHPSVRQLAAQIQAAL